MEVIVGKTAGFCYGVKRAVETTIKELENKKEKVYCLGELVHNKQVIEEVETLGANTIEEIKDIPETEKKDTIKIIIRAHGVPPKIYQEIEKKGYQLLDLTCPNVLAIHKVAIEASKEDKYIFLIGHKNHPEVIGINGCCEESSIIETEEDIVDAMKSFQKSQRKKALILSQTTFSLEKFNYFVEKIKEKIPNVEVKNTICNATRLRQEETVALSKKTSYMVIIGGKNSSNTKKLYEIAKANCPHTVCVETKDDVNLEEIQKQRKIVEANGKEFKIGMMAGASTPKEVICDIVNLFT